MWKPLTSCLIFWHSSGNYGLLFQTFWTTFFTIYIDVSSETTKLKKATYSDETLLYTINKVLEVKNSLLEERELKVGEINNRKQIKKVLLKQLIHP